MGMPPGDKFNSVDDHAWQQQQRCSLKPLIEDKLPDVLLLVGDFAPVCLLLLRSQWFVPKFTASLLLAQPPNGVFPTTGTVCELVNCISRCYFLHVQYYMHELPAVFPLAKSQIGSSSQCYECFPPSHKV